MRTNDCQPRGGLPHSAKKGVEVDWYGKSLQWVEWFAVINAGKFGSECFTWDKSGNRCLHDIKLHTLDLTDIEADVVVKTIGSSYRRLD